MLGRKCEKCGRIGPAWLACPNCLPVNAAELLREHTIRHAGGGLHQDWNAVRHIPVK